MKPNELKEDYIVRRNPVREALKANRPINKLLLARKADKGSVQEIKILAREKKIPVVFVERTYLDKMFPGIVHQGIVAISAAKGYLSIDELLLSAGAEPFLFLLPELNDPRNFGAIIRTAEAVGAHGIVITAHRSVSLTPAAIKASAGAFEYMPLCRVTNMVQTIKYLKQKNIWIVGAHPLAKEVFWDSRLDGPLALIIGSEGKGLGPLIRKNCDILVGLPMVGRLNSLNASVAAALLAYEVFRQRRLVAHGRAPDR